MKLEEKDLLLYGITDSSWTENMPLLKQVELALRGGVTILQLREKELPLQDFIDEAIAVKQLCEKYKVPLIINDNLMVAKACGADGIHVGMEDMSVASIREQMGADFIIGATAKTVEQARKAEKEGANYLGVGAIFPSPTKKNAIRITKKELNEICASVRIPAVAIGGITYDNMLELQGGKMKGLALISAIFSAKDIENATRVLKLRCEEIILSEEVACGII